MQARLKVQLLSGPTRLQLEVAKCKERLRLNSIKILHFDSRNTIIVNEAFRQVQSFIAELNLTYGLASSDILTALQGAHRVSDEYYTMDTTFVIPQVAIDADMTLFHDLNYDLKYKQQRLASNRISPARIRLIYGAGGRKLPGVDPKDISILLDFVTNGITPPVAPSFQPQSYNVPPFQSQSGISSCSIPSTDYCTNSIQMVP